LLLQVHDILLFIFHKYIHYVDNIPHFIPHLHLAKLKALPEFVDKKRAIPLSNEHDIEYLSAKWPK
jgi:hypothetical protein